MEKMTGMCLSRLRIKKGETNLIPVFNSGYIRNRDSSEVNNNGHDLENMKFQLDTWEFFTTVVGQAWKSGRFSVPEDYQNLKLLSHRII